MGDISSNMGGYPSSKDDTRKNDEDENLDKNEGSDNTGNEDINQGINGEDNVEEELDKEKYLGKEEAKGMEHPKDKKMDNPIMQASLSFLDTTKTKDDSSLHGDSQIYNEILKLNKNLGKVQKDHENDRAKLVLLEAQVGNIPGKLKEYEQDL